MSSIPYLTQEQQLKFLRDHHMICDGEIRAEDAAWMKSLNFHFLLGYGRNLRSLHAQGFVKDPPSLATIHQLVEAEIELTAFLSPWLRRAEWHLRSLTIDAYCEQAGSGEGYLDAASLVGFEDGDAERLQDSMLKAIRRHGEPYVVNHIRDRALEIGVTLPDHYDWRNRNLWLKLTEGLPLWATIDSFSMGTLGRFIMQTAPYPEGSTPVWKVVSGSLGITARHFGVSVESFGILRNAVFHHQRLWMRPIPKSPGFPNDLNRRYRDQGFKNKNKEAQFIALAMVSRFLPRELREAYLSELDAHMNRNELLSFGLMHSPSIKD